MTKFKKFLSIALLAVFSLTFLAGCGLFVVNEQRYREQVVMEVGAETVTLGELIDYFDTNGSSLVQQGQDVQTVWDSLFPVFIQQKILVNEYKTAFSEADKNTSEFARKYENGEYLDDATIEYLQLAVFSTFYAALDELTMENLSVKFTFADETTSDYQEMIDHSGEADGWTPAEDDSFLDADALEKDMEKYPADQDYEHINYVFSEDDERLQDILIDLNDRLEKANSQDPDVTAADYIEAQEKAVTSTTRNLRSNRSMTMDEYFVYAIEEQILSQIANEYLFGKYDEYVGKITEADFNTRLENLRAQAEAQFSQNVSAFADFISEISDSDFIYYVPEEYAGEYHYIRSILIPFSDEQTALLELAKAEYGENSAAYKTYRDSLAQGITVKDYSTDDKGVDTEISVATLLDRSNTFDGVSLADVTREQIIEWTYKYNTDPGMFNPVRGYIVSESPSNMTGSGETYVAEFLEGARYLIAENNGGGGTNATAVVTDYGIHILYYDGAVEADTISWADRFDYGIEGGGASYRFLKAMYDEVKDVLLDADVDALYKAYTDDGKITVYNNVLAGYANEIGVTL